MDDNFQSFPLFFHVPDKAPSFPYSSSWIEIEGYFPLFCSFIEIWHAIDFIVYIQSSCMSSDFVCFAEDITEMKMVIKMKVKVKMGTVMEMVTL